MAITNYVWDPTNDSYLMESNGDEESTVMHTQEPVQFGGLVSQRRNGDTSYYHFDQLGNTKVLTDAAESITDSYSYDAWGNDTGSTGDTVNPFRWVGRSNYYYDTESTETYVRDRTLRSSAARWLSTDLIGFIDGVNLFLYSHNRPLVEIDPGGNQCKLPKDVEYISDRGGFTTLILRGHTPGAPPPGVPAVDPATLWTVFATKWTPKYPFPGSNADCCCCDRIGFVQIARFDANWQTSGAMFPTSTIDWHIDGSIPYPLPFAPAGQQQLPTTADPCSGQTIGMGDMPGMPTVQLHPWGLGTATILKAVKSFETCAVCLNGIEGVHIYAHSDPFQGTHYSAAAGVYGCITWAIEIQRVKGKYLVRRRLNSDHSPGASDPGIPWSQDKVDPTWWNAGFNRPWGVVANGPSDKFRTLFRNEITPLAIPPGIPPF